MTDTGFPMKAVRGVRIGLRFVSPGGTFAVDGETAREMLRAGSATLLYPARDLARLGRDADLPAPEGIAAQLMTR